MHVARTARREAEIAGQRPVPDVDELQGLCVDDFFVVERARRTEVAPSERSEAFVAALEAYAREELPGSSSKLLDRVPQAVALGAEVDGRRPRRRGGRVTVAATQAFGKEEEPPGTDCLFDQHWCAFGCVRGLWVI